MLHTNPDQLVRESRRMRFYLDAIEARSKARLILRSRLPGWRIYHRMGMQRAISKWKQFKEMSDVNQAV